MDKAIKLNLSKPVKSEFTRISDKILAYIKQITPNSEKLSTFGIHSYDDDSADTFKVYYDNGVIKVYGVYDTNLRMVQLKNNDYPGLAEFLTDFTEVTIYSKVTPQSIKDLYLPK